MDRRTVLAGAAAIGASALTAGVVPGGPVASASAGTSGSWRAGLARLHEAMAARVARRELPGIVYLVAHRGLLHVNTIGTLTLDGHEPMRRSTPFRMASMTKPITAAATMMLVEEGRLALDEPVDRLLPELANRRVLTRIDGPLDQTVPAARPITVEDLLTFRMGHGIIFEPSFQPPYPIITAANELQLVMDQPDPRTPHHPDEWIRRFGTLPLTIRIEATLGDYRRLLAWARKWPERRWAAEGASGLGRHLSPWLVARGETVVDVHGSATA